VLVLVVEGCLVGQGRVATLAVVEDLDEVEHRGPEGLTGRPVIAVQQLALEGGEEAFGDRIVQRVPTVPIEAISSEAVR